MEPESPNTQLPLSPFSHNHSESEDSDKQIRFSNQEISNSLMQNMDTKVYSSV